MASLCCIVVADFGRAVAIVIAAVALETFQPVVNAEKIAWLLLLLMFLLQFLLLVAVVIVIVVDVVVAAVAVVAVVAAAVAVVVAVVVPSRSPQIQKCCCYCF